MRKHICIELAVGLYALSQAQAGQGKTPLWSKFEDTRPSTTRRNSESQWPPFNIAVAF